MARTQLLTVVYNGEQLCSRHAMMCLLHKASDSDGLFAPS
jgi:hypothetical protein